MPEPTDHRAKAEHWLSEFHATIGATPPNLRDVLRLAHIHALLAQQRPGLADAWDQGYRNGYRIGFADDPNACTNYENPYRNQPDTEQAPLDELLPTIPSGQVPTGTTLYAPSGREILAYVSGKWRRRV